MWNLLKRIAPNSSEPWLMVGDFNETMWQHEDLSYAKRSERKMANFRETLSFCDLHDLGYQGPSWTYDNKQQGNKNIRAKIDRAVASLSRCDLFTNHSMTDICSTRSDHFPVLEQTEYNYWRKKNNRQFHYEQMWERMPSLQSTVEQVWKEKGKARDLAEVSSKLGSMRGALTKWSRNNFGSVLRKTKLIRDTISRLFEETWSVDRDEEVKELSAELDELLPREEIMWKQRSRVQWLREWDRNMKYFQWKATYSEERGWFLGG